MRPIAKDFSNTHMRTKTIHLNGITAPYAAHVISKENALGEPIAPSKILTNILKIEPTSKKLMAWSHSILNPNDKTDKDQQSATTVSTVTPTASDTEESKE